MASMSSAPAVPAEHLERAQAVQAYKDFSRVERAFRIHEDRRSRDPPDPPLDRRTRARPCLPVHARLSCRMASAPDALAPLLFHDTDLDAARAERSSPVCQTEPSPAAREPRRRPSATPMVDRVISFAGLIDHLGTMTRNTMRMPLALSIASRLLPSRPPLQEAAFNLLGLDPKRVQ